MHEGAGGNRRFVDTSGVDIAERYFRIFSGPEKVLKYLSGLNRILSGSYVMLKNAFLTGQGDRFGENQNQVVEPRP